MNNLTLLGGAGIGLLAGMSMVTRDDARIETGTALEIIIAEPSETL